MLTMADLPFDPTEPYALSPPPGGDLSLSSSRVRDPSPRHCPPSTRSSPRPAERREQVAHGADGMPRPSPATLPPPGAVSVYIISPPASSRSLESLLLPAHSPSLLRLTLPPPVGSRFLSLSLSSPLLLPATDSLCITLLSLFSPAGSASHLLSVSLYHSHCLSSDRPSHYLFLSVSLPPPAGSPDGSVSLPLQQGCPIMIDRQKIDASIDQRGPCADRSSPDRQLIEVDNQ